MKYEKALEQRPKRKSELRQKYDATIYNQAIEDAIVKAKEDGNLITVLELEKLKLERYGK